MSSILTTTESELVQDERTCLAALVTRLRGWDLEVPGVGHLAEAVEGLDGLFLLVVTGEFNSGKSALINALLGGRHLEEGVTPTTRDVQVLSHGPEGPARQIDGHWHRTLPVDILTQLQIVDTPGTNAIIRSHEALTREYVPRADLILFVTSSDRPFSESEREFLEVIRNWGKKIIFVVNKIDLLENADQERQVVDFVRRGAGELLGADPTVFAVSARCTLRAPGTDPACRESAQKWREFTDWIRTRLTEGERVRLKLLSPIGVADKVMADAVTRLAERQDLLDADRGTLSIVESGIDDFALSITSGLEPRLDRIDNQIMALRERGEAFLDSTFRVTRIRDLLSEERLQRLFEEQVIENTPDEIEAEVGAIIDWLVETEQTQWAAVRSGLEQRRSAGSVTPADAPAGFAARRQALLGSVGSRTDEVVAGFDPILEGARLAESVQSTLAQTALVEVSAIGLGLILKALLVSAAADATGILAAGIVAVFGLTLLPHRRRKAAEALRHRTTEVREELRSAITTAVDAEISSAEEQMSRAVAPYSDFLNVEGEQLGEMKDDVSDFQAQANELRGRIDRLASGQSRGAAQ